MSNRVHTLFTTSQTTTTVAAVFPGEGKILTEEPSNDAPMAHDATPEAVPATQLKSFIPVPTKSRPPNTPSSSGTPSQRKVAPNPTRSPPTSLTNRTTVSGTPSTVDSNSRERLRRPPDVKDGRLNPSANTAGPRPAQSSVHDTKQSSLGYSREASSRDAVAPKNQPATSGIEVSVDRFTAKHIKGNLAATLSSEGAPLAIKLERANLNNVGKSVGSDIHAKKQESSQRPVVGYRRPVTPEQTGGIAFSLEDCDIGDVEGDIGSGIMSSGEKINVHVRHTKIERVDGSFVSDYRAGAHFKK